jgi:hypothetical protein
VVIHDLDIYGTWRTFRPSEADSPLIIDADAELSSPVAFESLQPIAPQGAEDAYAAGRTQYSQPFPGLLFDASEGRNTLAIGKCCRPLVPVAQDHRQVVVRIT